MLAMLAGVAFAALNQALAALLGGVGRFVAMVVAAVALATGVISTAPTLLTDVAAGCRPAARWTGCAARWRAAPGSVARRWHALWTAAGLAVTTLAIARKRVVEVTQQPAGPAPDPPTPHPPDDQGIPRPPRVVIKEHLLPHGW